MNYIDVKYVGLLGQQLRNFKKKNDTLFNCSCPICGDSLKKKTKARGYFYVYQNSMLYKCHNCHASMSLAFLLKNHFSSLYGQYSIEKFSEFEDYSKTVKKAPLTPPIIAKPQADVTHKHNIDDFAIKIKSLSEKHFAKQYILNRRLPETAHDALYFSEDFSSLVKNLFPGVEKNLKPNDARLVIPFYDADKNIIAIQGRSFCSSNQLRYITIKSRENCNLIYGLDRYNSELPGYVVEGPIDSLFLSNCLATANSNLQYACSIVNNNLTLIFDNEPKNAEILQLIESAIENERRVCIWPKHITQKDINDMVSSGISIQNLKKIINERTFSGIRALLEFTQWKRR
jgi:hypothetical protein